MARSFRVATATVLVYSLFLALGAVELIAQPTRPYLVKISRTDSDALALIRQRSVPVNFKLAEWFIAEVNETDLERFQAAGLAFEILDREAWSQPYYLITKPNRQLIGDIPAVGRTVYQTEFEAIVKIAENEVLDLGRAGFQLTRLFQRPLPLVERQAAKPISFRERIGASDVIGALVNQVSQATTRAYVQRLQDFQTRFVDTDSILAAAQWLSETFMEFGYTDVIFQDFIVSAPYRYNVMNVLVRNVIATKPGILYPDSVFIIGGHYDSILYDGTDPRVWAPGANDNASAIGATLEAARILADIDLDCTVKFACWTAEEIGLLGAEHYAAQAFHDGEHIGLYINFDMIANVDASDPVRDVYIGRSSGAQAYSDLMVQLTNQYTTLVPLPYVTSSSGSDHGPFMQYGFDILYNHEGDFSPHWHLASDIIDNMDISYLCEVVKMGLATLVAVAGPPESFPNPLIAFEDYEMDDDDEGGSMGNENGYFDPGETVQVELSLYNYGDTQANDVSGRLLTDDQYVIILDNEVSFGNIPSGGIGTSQSQFRFVISEDCPNGHSLNFSVDASAAGGYHWTTYFVVRIEQPVLLYNTFSFEEIIGNGDGTLDPGETVDLYIRMENAGLRNAAGMTAALETDDPDVTITDSEAVFPDVAVDAICENAGDPFTFSLNSSSDLHGAVFTLHVSEEEGYYETDVTFRLLIGQRTVLLVVDDAEADNRGFYIEAFQYLGVPYELQEMQGVAKSVAYDLEDFTEVIWFTGSAEENTLTPEDQNGLEAFLTDGGRLLLSGSLIGYDIGETPFYRNFLHGRYVSFMTMLHHLNGATSNPVVGDMNITLSSDGPNAQGFAGETDPISPAVSIFNYDRSTGEGPGTVKSSGSGALAVETSAYKVVYCSFGLEGVEPLEDRAQVLEDVLLWFKEVGVDKGDTDGNGTTNIIDAVVAVNIVLGLHQPTEGEVARSDMNYDGVINILDVVLIVNAILGG